MDAKLIQQIFADTAYIRVGGSPEELKAAEYIRDVCATFGATATIEEFDVQMATMHSDTLTVDGVEIPCKGYLNAGSHEVEAPLYYLTGKDKYALEGCRGKIVMFDGYLGYWRYRDLLENGAVGIITYDGSVNYADRNIDRRELRAMASEGVEKIPCVNINAKDAVALIKGNAKTAKITLKQDEYVGKSQSVILDLPGESDEVMIFTAHYDSTSLSEGAYDNMSGSVGLLALAEYFTTHVH
ncbi:MAG: M28 family peptidase [Clostridia bacterium]|nr:M28 family peptidase [Clostridia bacterium]